MTQGCSFMAGETKDGGLCIGYAIDFLILFWNPRIVRNGIERWVSQKILSLTPYLSWITKGSQYSYKGIRVVSVRARYVYLATLEVIPDDHAPYWFFSLCLETMKLERLFQKRFEGCFYPYIMAWPLDMKLKALRDNSWGSMVNRMIFKVACCGEVEHLLS